MKIFGFAKNLSITATAFAALAFAAPATAEDLVQLKSGVQVERTVTQDGAEQTVMSEPSDVVPGDRLVFTTEYSNVGTEPVENFVVTNPLPDAVRLADTDGSFEVSIDGGKTFGALAAMSVQDAEVGNRAATLTDVTHLRWTLARLAPGATGTLGYNAIVR